MVLKISARQFVQIVCISITASLVVIFFINVWNTTQISLHRADYRSVSSSEFPILLHIPLKGIEIDSQIEHVGILPDGTMEMPKKKEDVGWFNLGKIPGKSGTAVIAGHYGWKDGKASAFDNINKLKKGDEINIEDGKGLITTFIVTESRIFDPKASTTDIFNSNDGKSHLNLITCEGVWDPLAKSYSERLVVFTDKKTI